MKKAILIITTVLSILAAKAQDTVNYIVVYRDTVLGDAGLRTLSPVPKITGFRTQNNLAAFLNEKVDSTGLIGVFDVRTKKPMTASFSTAVVDRVITVKDRVKKWNVR